jgi:hypothetical protein
MKSPARTQISGESFNAMKTRTLIMITDVDEMSKEDDDGGPRQRFAAESRLPLTVLPVIFSRG